MNDNIKGFGVALTNNSQLRVMREGGVWRVAAKLKRYHRDKKVWEHKWFVGDDTELEWAIAKLYGHSYPSDRDTQLALYIRETKLT